MNLLYISFINEDLRPGYKKKIHEMAQAFSNIGFSTHLVITGNNGIRRYSFFEDKEELEDQLDFNRKNNERNIPDDLMLFAKFVSYVKKYVTENKIDYVYIRRITPLTPKLLRLIKYIKKKEIKQIAYEYPSWPWKNEGKGKAEQGLMRKVFLLLDNMFFNSLVKSVDTITYIGQSRLSNEKFVRIQNCGMPKDYKKKSGVIHIDDKVTFVIVAHMVGYHGIDRVLEGIATYYKTTFPIKVYFNIVGDGEIRQDLEKRTVELKLENYVRFHGYQSGGELDSIFEESDIAINPLTIKKEKGGSMTSLKTVEYTFRGIPQISILPFQIDGGECDKPDFLYIVEDDTINIKEIIDYFYGKEFDPSDIRDYAIEHMSWEKVLSKVFPQ